MATRRTIRETLAEAESLGMFPRAALRIREVAARPTSSASDMEDAIGLEPALSARVLRLANSPFYGLRRSVGSIREAVFVLGHKAIQGLALSLAVLAVEGDESEERRCQWRHALGVAAAARRFSGFLPRGGGAEALVAGLLHDLGVNVLMEVYGVSEVAGLRWDALHPERPLRAEVERFGCDHASLTPS